MSCIVLNQAGFVVVHVKLVAALSFRLVFPLFPLEGIGQAQESRMERGAMEHPLRVHFIAILLGHVTVWNWMLCLVARLRSCMLNFKCCVCSASQAEDKGRLVWGPIGALSLGC